MKAQSDSEEQRKQQQILPPQSTPQMLARLLGGAECCWVLEDFHKMESTEKVKLAQIMKVFMDMADAYRNLKIIAIGAVGSARQAVEADAEMKNRVSEIFVPLMSDEEIGQIIQKGQDLLNFSMNINV